MQRAATELQHEHTGKINFMEVTIKVSEMPQKL